MNSPYFSQISSKELEIVQRRYTNLEPNRVLQHILSKGFIEDEQRFKDIFWFSNQIYEQSSRRFSGEMYALHPLRMLMKEADLGFRNQTLSEIIMGHDVIEKLRDESYHFQNPKKLENEFEILFSEHYHYVEKITPTKDGTPKDKQLENLIKTSSSFSSFEVNNKYVKMKLPTILPVPLCIIAKIYDIEDNAYDQRKFSPNGILAKTRQIQVIREYIEKEMFSVNMILGSFQNHINGFPLNLITILNALLDNAQYNLNK